MRAHLEWSAQRLDSDTFAVGVSVVLCEDSDAPQGAHQPGLQSADSAKSEPPGMLAKS